MRGFFAALVVLSGMAVVAGDLEAILSKNLEACGGAEKLKAFQTVRMSGKCYEGGMEIPFTMTRKKPQMLRLEYAFNGVTIIQSFDGEMGWQINPLHGDHAPQPMDSREIRELKHNIFYAMPLKYMAGEGVRFSLVGNVTLEARDAIHLKAVKPDGLELDFFLDAQTYLVLKRVHNIKDFSGGESQMTVVFPEYADVDGLRFPKVVVTTKSNCSAPVKVVFEKIEPNIKLSESFFKQTAYAAYK